MVILLEKQRQKTSYLLLISMKKHMIISQLFQKQRVQIIIEKIWSILTKKAPDFMQIWLLKKLKNGAYSSHIPFSLFKENYKRRFLKKSPFSNYGCFPI